MAVVSECKDPSSHLLRAAIFSSKWSGILFISSNARRYVRFALTDRNKRSEMKRRIPSVRHRSTIVLLIALFAFSGVVRASPLVDGTANADIAAAISSGEDESGAMPTEATESGEGIDAVKKYMTRSKRSIYFARDSAELSAEALNTVSENAQRLKSRPELTVTLVGFSDIVGSSSYSVALAQRRAKVVTDALVRMGVATRQIRPSAVGLEEPGVMPCITEICKLSYRRVEFRYRGGTTTR